MRRVSGITRSLVASAVAMAVLGTTTAALAQPPVGDLLTRVPEAYRAASAGIEPDPATMVPEALRDSCRPNPYWEATKVAGELAAANCDPDGFDGPDHATYSLFLTKESMDGRYDVFATEYRDVGSLGGPGCGQGPGEGTWAGGRRFCYTYAGLSASTYWTHEGLRVLGSSSRPDTDWAALDAFWQSAGPIAP